MAIWAIADLHLYFGAPEKHMKVFGPQWEFYTEKIESEWRRFIKTDDLVLIAGDISWAMHIKQAYLDLQWIHHLPGTKVLLKGNHDYWWSSLTKMKPFLPSSCHFIQNNSFTWDNNVSIAGSRLWDTNAYQFNSYIDYQKNENIKKIAHLEEPEEREKIFQREIGRLEMSLKTMNPHCQIRIAMTHYPPIGVDLQDSIVSRLLEKYHIQICVFGHLHNVKKNLSLFGTHHNITYHLTSSDYLNFKPLLILN